MNSPGRSSPALPLTLRRPRSAPQRHAEIGEPIGLWTGWRTPQVKMIATGLVVLRASIALAETGIARVADLRVRDADQQGTEALEQMLAAPAAASADAFARLDGFENWPSLWAWHDRHRTASERLAAALERELICWRLLEGDAAAAAAHRREILPEAV